MPSRRDMLRILGGGTALAAGAGVEQVIAKPHTHVEEEREPVLPELYELSTFENAERIKKFTAEFWRDFDAMYKVVRPSSEEEILPQPMADVLEIYLEKFSWAVGGQGKFTDEIESFALTTALALAGRSADDPLYHIVFNVYVPIAQRMVANSLKGRQVPNTPNNNALSPEGEDA